MQAKAGKQASKQASGHAGKQAGMFFFRLFFVRTSLVRNCRQGNNIGSWDNPVILGRRVGAGRSAELLLLLLVKFIEIVNQPPQTNLFLRYLQMFIMAFLGLKARSSVRGQSW